jgi:hypothetical protein
VKMLPQSRTRSMGSRVLPAVTKTLRGGMVI